MSAVVSKRRAPQQVDKAGSRSLASVVRAPSRGYPPSSLPPPSTMDEAKLLSAELVRAAPELLAEEAGSAAPGPRGEGKGEGKAAPGPKAEGRRAVGASPAGPIAAATPRHVAAGAAEAAEPGAAAETGAAAGVEAGAAGAEDKAWWLARAEAAEARAEANPNP